MSGRTLRPHASIGVVAQLAPTLGEREARAVDLLARRLQAESPHLAAVSFLGPGVRCGAVPGPGLFFEDHSGLEFSVPKVPDPFEHRIRLLAGDGDVLLTGSRHVGFEEYCRDRLDLGTPEVLEVAVAAMPLRPLAVRAAEDPAVIAKLARVAADAGALTLFPYLGNGNAWRLASQVAQRAGVTVHVAAAPPNLTLRANDKLWFSRCVRELLGSAALPPGHGAYGAAALTAQVRALARRHGKVVVKVPGSASGSGNVTIDSRDVADLPLRAARDRLLAALRARGWIGGYPLLVSVWECAATGSPSVQTWIPRPEEGAPLIEGIFDQQLQAEHREFVGAEPSRLPGGLCERLAHEALMLASLLQSLGYFGRCSFDALVIGDDPCWAGVRWVDCNARWGGVSLPLSAVNRLTGDWSRHGLVIVQQSQAHASLAFDEMLSRLAPFLYRPGRGQGVVLSAPTTEGSAGVLDLTALGATQEAARTLASDALASLQGGGPRRAHERARRTAHDG